MNQIEQERENLGLKLRRKGIKKRKEQIKKQKRIRQVKKKKYRKEA